MRREKNRKVSFIEKLIRLIYPAKCMVCDTILNDNAVLYLCESCKKNLPRYQREFRKSAELPYLDGIFAAFYYKNGVDTAIHNMKFKNQPKLAQTIGSLVCEEMLKHGPLPDFDYIVPVPMHPKKKRQRGYNQAELVAKEEARILEKEIRTDILLKIQNTKPQILLKREERLRNLEGAFKVNDNNIIEKNHNKHILLVDDVLTTGTTINTCARILKESGFSSVYALVIALAEK